jgi:hypothetical protein
VARRRLGSLELHHETWRGRVTLTRDGKRRRTRVDLKKDRMDVAERRLLSSLPPRRLRAMGPRCRRGARTEGQP